MSAKKQGTSVVSNEDGLESTVQKEIGCQTRRTYFKKIRISFILIASVMIISGCGLFGGEKQSKKIDPPEEVSIVNEDEITLTGEEDEQAAAGSDGVKNDTAKVELYLIDKNGYVVPQTLALPNEEGIAKLSLQSLVQDGPMSDMLPSGFQAVLPTDTEVMGINIKDGVAVVDLSKEFVDYKKENEQQIIESIVWTMTQFESIDRVKLQINGHALDEMPANGTAIGDGLTRKIGINVDTTNMVDATNTKPVTVYYLGQEGETYYYVPVTRRVSNAIENNVEAVVKELVAGPSHTSQLLSDFLPGVALLDEPKVEDGKVTLNFNSSIIGSVDQNNIISQHVLTSLVLSLTEQQGIESVSVLVNGDAELVNEQGEKLTAPVTRPEKVNMLGL